MRSASGTRVVGAALPWPHRAGDVPGRHQRGQHPAHAAFLRGERLQELHLHQRLLARQQVAHLRGEDVGALLVQQRRAVTLGDGVVVGAEGGLALLHHAGHAAARARHGEGAERRVGGQGEGVEGLHRLLLVVAVALRHAHPRVPPEQLTGDFHSLQGHLGPLTREQPTLRLLVHDSVPSSDSSMRARTRSASARTFASACSDTCNSNPGARSQRW